jgi:hypothetical protein
LAGFGRISNGGSVQAVVFGKVDTKNSAVIFATDLSNKGVWAAMTNRSYENRGERKRRSEREWEEGREI